MIDMLRPLRDLVLIRPDTTTQSRRIARNDGSIATLVLPPTAQHERPYGRVLATGPDCRYVAVGQRVLYDTTLCQRVSSDDIVAIGHAATGNSAPSPDASLLCRECDIIATIELDAASATSDAL